MTNEEAKEAGLTVREACKRGVPLDGSDAQALEHALTMTERERDEVRAQCAAMAKEVLAAISLLPSCAVILDQEFADCLSGVADTLTSALSGTAGQDLLREVESLRKVAETLAGKGKP